MMRAYGIAGAIIFLSFPVVGSGQTAASGGQTKESPSSWTVDTLKSHFEELLAEVDKRYEQRFEGQEKAVNAALTAAKEAVAKAENAAEKRFDSVNEFRGQLSDQARTFMPRPESEQRMQTLDDKIAAVTKVCIGAVLFCVAIITVVLLIMRPQFAPKRAP